MMLPKERFAIQKQFDHAAQSYDEAASWQPHVLTQLLDQVSDCNLHAHTIIDLGTSTAGSHQPLAQQFPQAQIFHLDLSLQMLKKAKSQQHDLILINSDAHTLPFKNNSVDLIFSSLMIQWCDDIHQVLKECFRVLKPHGILFFSSVGPQTLNELTKCYQHLNSTAPINPFLDMHDYGDQLSQLNYEKVVMQQETVTVHYSSVKALFTELKQTGANYVISGRQKNLLGGQFFKKLEHYYLENFGINSDIPATYDIIYAHAQKPKPQQIKVSITSLTQSSENKNA